MQIFEENLYFLNEIHSRFSSSFGGLGFVKPEKNALKGQTGTLQRVLICSVGAVFG